MRARPLFQLSFAMGFLSLVLSIHALPPASSLSAREKRTAPRRSTPTPAPAVAPPVAATRSTRSEPVAQESRPSTVVVVDAGHGGFDRGGIPGQRVAEKMMTLDVAQRLRATLQASGYRVVMTRASDVFIPLGTRVAIGNSHRNAIFVSIHFNSASRRGANGIETYFYSRDSLALASAIHYHVVGATPTLNRGVRRRGFFVLRRSRIPAVLVECGFLTNPTEAGYTQSSAYRQRLAESIARGIRSRSQVGSSSRVAATGTVPLQPFIDQTRMRSERSSRRSRKSARARSSAKKRAAKKQSAASDASSSSKKKSSSKKSEN